MPTDGDNILGYDRAILVISTMQQFSLNFREIIIDEMKIRILRTDTAYPFPCLIAELCRAANMPEISGIDNDIPSWKTHNPIWYDENQPGLRLDKGADLAEDPLVTDVGSLPNVEVQDSETAQLTFQHRQV